MNLSGWEDSWDLDENWAAPTTQYSQNNYNGFDNYNQQPAQYYPNQGGIVSVEQQEDVKNEESPERNQAAAQNEQWDAKPIQSVNQNQQTAPVISQVNQSAPVNKQGRKPPMQQKRYNMNKGNQIHMNNIPAQGGNQMVSQQKSSVAPVEIVSQPKPEEVPVAAFKEPEAEPDVMTLIKQLQERVCLLESMRPSTIGTTGKTINNGTLVWDSPNIVFSGKNQMNPQKTALIIGQSGIYNFNTTIKGTIKELQIVIGHQSFSIRGHGSEQSASLTVHANANDKVSVVVKGVSEGGWISLTQC